jgi:hypothetical protein
MPNTHGLCKTLLKEPLGNRRRRVFVEDPIRFGRVVVGVCSLFFAVVLACSRLYVHRFKKWMRKAHREI